MKDSFTATVRTDNPELRREFLCIIADNYTRKGETRSGRLLVSVGEMKQEGDEYIFEVEYQ